MRKVTLRLVPILLSLMTVFGVDSKGEGGGIIADLEKLVVSNGLEDRLLAQSILAEQISLVPSDMLSDCLVAGLTDNNKQVCLAAVAALNENARTVASLKDCEKIEAVLEKMVSDDIETLRTACRTEGDEAMLVRVLCAIANVRYFRMPFVNYCEWETENLVPLIRSFGESGSIGELCAATVLCGYVQAPQNLQIVVENLKVSLDSKVDKIRRKGVLAVSSFQYSEELLILKLDAFVALEGPLQKVANEDSSEIGSLAKEVVKNLRRLLLVNQERLGIVVFPKSGGRGQSNDPNLESNRDVREAVK